MRRGIASVLLGGRQVITSSLSIFYVPRAACDGRRPNEYNIILYSWRKAD